MRTKITEEITLISGVDTNPFNRYVGKISLNELMNRLNKERTKAEEMGYENLEVLIQENRGIVDIYLYGDRGLTEEEKDMDERIAVIARQKEKTSKGLTRKDLIRKAEIFLSSRNMIDNEIDVGDELYDCNNEKLYISDVIVEFYLDMQNE